MTKKVLEVGGVELLQEDSFKLHSYIYWSVN